MSSEIAEKGTQFWKLIISPFNAYLFSTYFIQFLKEWFLYFNFFIFYLSIFSIFIYFLFNLPNMSEDQSSFKTLQRSKKIIFNFFFYMYRCRLFIVINIILNLQNMTLKYLNELVDLDLYGHDNNWSPRTTDRLPIQLMNYYCMHIFTYRILDRTRCFS